MNFKEAISYMLAKNIQTEYCDTVRDYPFLSREVKSSNDIYHIEEDNHYFNSNGYCGNIEKQLYENGTKVELYYLLQILDKEFEVVE